MRFPPHSALRAIFPPGGRLKNYFYIAALFEMKIRFNDLTMYHLRQTIIPLSTWRKKEDVLESLQ